MDILAPLGCFVLLLFVVALGIFIALWSQFAAVKDRLDGLERRIRELNQELLRRPIVQGPARSVVEPPPVQPAMYSAPPAPPVTFPPPSATAEALEEAPEARLEEVVEEAAPRRPEPVPAAPVTEAAAAAPPPLPTPPPPRPPVLPRPSPRPGLEAYVGTKLFVVIGAIALALAGIFLVKLAVQRQYLTEGVRVSLGAAAGIVLIGIGQWRRRQESLIAQGLMAAGIVALFAAIFAATSLYHFLPPIAGFGLLAAVTALAVMLSLQKEGGGPLLATLGLIGGFITPLLVSTDSPNVPGLFGYLLLLHVGLVAVTRMRGWAILAALSVLFSSAWLLIWLIFMPWKPEHGSVLGLFMLASVFALFTSTAREPERWRGNFSATALTWLSGALALLAACLLVGKSNFSDLEWAFFAALAAGAFVLARLRPRYEGLAWICVFAILMMLMAWGLTGGPLYTRLNDPAAILHLRWLMAVFGVASVAAAYACMFKSAVPMRWGLLAVTLAIGYVLGAYLATSRSPRADEWAWIALATAAALAILAVPVFRRRAAMATGEITLAFFAHGILALCVIASPMALTNGALIAAWCATLPLTALAVWRLRIPALLLGFLFVLALVVLRGLALWNLVDPAPNDTLWWNPIVWIYGSLLLATSLSAWLVERSEDYPETLRPMLPRLETISAILQTVAAAAGFMLLTLLVRWHFHSGHLAANHTILLERATYGVAWLVLACALVWLGGALHRTMLVRCGELVAIAGLIYAAVAILFGASSWWWWGESVGPLPVLNLLLYIYGLPALLCAAVAYLLRASGGSQTVARWTGFIGMALVFMLVSSQVRQGFVGEHLQTAGASFKEIATYPIAWLAAGIVCLWIGRRFARPTVHGAGVLFTVAGAAYTVGVTAILANPVVQGGSVGRWLVLNQLLYAYGVPAALCLVVVYVLESRRRFFGPPLPIRDSDAGRLQDSLGQMMRLGAAILLLVLLTMEVRQGFQGEFLNRPRMGFVERATHGVAWLLLAAALAWLARRTRERIIPQTALVAATAALAWMLVVGGVVMNPLMHHESVGTWKILNWLLYAYAVPAVAGGIMASVLWNHRDEWPRNLAVPSGVAALLLTFILVTLQVRHFFQGQFLDAHTRSLGEMAAYSMAWAGLGGAFLVAGILRKSAMLRWASLVVMFVTIIKVFLFDIPDLKDFMLVLSLAGLGASLIALAFVYTHFVFRRPTRPADPALAADPPAG